MADRRHRARRVSCATGVVALALGMWPMHGASASDCRPSPAPPIAEWMFHAPTGTWQWERTADVDGDGRIDRLVVHSAPGSSATTRLVELFLAGRDTPIRAAVSIDYTRMVQRFEVPRALRGPDASAARRAVEELLFTSVCPEPDPSMRAALQPNAKPAWLRGTPTLPSLPCAVYQEGDVPHWVHYAGHMHRATYDNRTDGTLEVVDERGPLRLYKSAHGVVVENSDTHRYAWLYVFPGAPGHRLRHPSVDGASFVPGGVEIEVTRIGTDSVDAGLIHVYLDGRDREERWTPRPR